MENFVSFELAKLLKEKGFDNPVLSYYDSYYDSNRFCLNYSIINQYVQEYIEDTGNCLIIPYTSGVGSLDLETINFNGWGVNSYSAPIVAEVVMWLYEKHKIWIVVNMDIIGRWYYDTYLIKDGIPNHNTYKKIERFKSPTEAYEAAIEYILNNLI